MSRRTILALVRIDATIGVAAVAAAVMASAGAAAPDVRSAPTILVARGDGTDSPIFRATLGDGVAHPVAGTRGATPVFEGSATAALASRGGQLLRVPFRRDDRLAGLATLPGARPDVLIPSRDATHVAAGIWCAEAARAMRVFGIYHPVGCSTASRRYEPAEERFDLDHSESVRPARRLLGADARDGRVPGSGPDIQASLARHRAKHFTSA